MTNPLIRTVSPLLLAAALSASLTACDPDSSESPSVRELDLDVIDAWADDRFAYQVVELDGARRMVADATQGDRRLVIVAELDGTPLAVALTEGGQTRRLDLDALIGGAIETTTDTVDLTSEAVLERVVEHPAIDDFRQGLVAPPPTQRRLMDCLYCAWDTIFGNPDLKSPSCDFC